MAKAKKVKKACKYVGTLNEKTGKIDWTSPVKTSTDPTDPPPGTKPPGS